MLAAAERPTRVRVEARGAIRELFRRRETEVVVSGPAGTGKTFGALWKLHACALKYAGMRGIMLRKVQEDLTASALVTYQERILGAGNFGVRPFGGSKLVPASFQYPNGSTLMIGGLDKADKVMSREYDLIYVVEITEIDEEDHEKLTTRLRWGRMPYQQLFGDCNPQGPGHWLYKRAKAGRTTMLFSGHEDNPALWDGHAWTEAGAAYLAKLDKLTGFRRDRLRDGVWRAAEGVVYPLFSRETHVRAVECAQWGTILALDVGTRNPTALLTIRHAGDRIHLERELYQRGMSSDAIVDAVVAAYFGSGAEYVVIDPSAAGIAASLIERGVVVRLATNDVKIGITQVTSALADLTVDPSCVNTIDEFETYRYPTGGARDNNDSPVKENDHCLIAGTMVETADGPMPIEAIRPGDLVWTRDGLRRVVAAGITSNLTDVYRLETSDGRALIGSALHPIWTDNRGWAHLDSLRYDDILGVWETRSKRSNSTASRSAATVGIRTSARMPGIAARALVGCTKKSGKAFTGLSLTGTRFITRISTRSTTIRRISSVLPSKSTDGFTQRDREAIGSDGISKKCARSRRRGTVQTPGGRGMQSTPKPYSRNAFLNLGPATNAGRRSKRWGGANPIGFAATLVSLLGVVLPALTMRTGRAPFVARYSGQTNTAKPRLVPVRVERVVSLPRKHRVYNLTVADTPEFFANGILVHNSMDALRYGVMELARPTIEVVIH